MFHVEHSVAAGPVSALCGKNPIKLFRFVFTTKAAMGAAKVHKEASNTLASGHFLCALCADLGFFAVKVPSSHNGQIFTTKDVKGSRKGSQSCGAKRERVALILPFGTLAWTLRPRQ